jgi:hypothetical protein
LARARVLAEMARKRANGLALNRASAPSQPIESENEWTLSGWQ